MTCARRRGHASHVRHALRRPFPRTVAELGALLPPFAPAHRSAGAAALSGLHARMRAREVRILLPPPPRTARAVRTAPPHIHRAPSSRRGGARRSSARCTGGSDCSLPGTRTRSPASPLTSGGPRRHGCRRRAARTHGGVAGHAA